MNLWFRVLWLLLATRTRAPVTAFGPCFTPLRVWPTDLDTLWHVNNGVFLSMMDLGRLDLMLRSGLARKVKANGWFTVVVAETIQFRRSLTLFQRFVIETRVLGWDDKAILIEQQFIRGDEVCVHALVRARVLRAGGGHVTPAQFAEVVGLDPQSPPLEGYAARWNADQGQWRGRAVLEGNRVLDSQA